MPLTATEVRNAKASDKPRKLFDGGGLFLLVKPEGAKWWRLKYRFQGREKQLSMGVYPAVPLKEARQRREDAKRLLAEGLDPSAEKQAQRLVGGDVSADAFELVAREWFARKSPTWAESHSSKIIRRLELDVFPYIGKQPVGQVTAPELLKVARRIEQRGAIETAHRAIQNCGQVFRYAVATGRADRNPAGDLRGALQPTVEKHHASIIDPKQIGGLLWAIDGYSGSPVTRAALQFAPLVFVRPGELRQAEWSEFDLANSEWRIPADRMKMNTPHIVPLSTQAKLVLDDLHPLTGDGRYVFPGERSQARPMSENTVNAALRRMGYTKDEMTGHGFRSMASTLLNEQGWNRDAIERQLAHAERDEVRAAYNYADYLPERRKMMQAWSDYLDGLRAGGAVIAINCPNVA